MGGKAAEHLKIFGNENEWISVWNEFYAEIETAIKNPTNCRDFKFAVSLGKLFGEPVGERQWSLLHSGLDAWERKLTEKVEKPAKPRNVDSGFYSREETKLEAKYGEVIGNLTVVRQLLVCLVFAKHILHEWAFEKREEIQILLGDDHVPIPSNLVGVINNPLDWLDAVCGITSQSHCFKIDPSINDARPLSSDEVRDVLTRLALRKDLKGVASATVPTMFISQWNGKEEGIAAMLTLEALNRKSSGIFADRISMPFLRTGETFRESTKVAESWVLSRLRYKREISTRWTLEILGSDRPIELAASQAKKFPYCGQSAGAAFAFGIAWLHASLRDAVEFQEGYKDLLRNLRRIKGQRVALSAVLEVNGDENPQYNLVAVGGLGKKISALSSHIPGATTLVVAPGQHDARVIDISTVTVIMNAPTLDIAIDRIRKQQEQQAKEPWYTSYKFVAVIVGTGAAVTAFMVAERANTKRPDIGPDVPKPTVNSAGRSSLPEANGAITSANGGTGPLEHTTIANSGTGALQHATTNIANIGGRGRPSTHHGNGGVGPSYTTTGIPSTSLVPGTQGPSPDSLHIVNNYPYKVDLSVTCAGVKLLANQIDRHVGRNIDLPQGAHVESCEHLSCWRTDMVKAEALECERHGSNITIKVGKLQ